MARPTKLTKELQAEICKHLRDGAFRRFAAGLVKIDEDSISRWYHRGATEDRGIYRDFYLAVNESESEFVKTGVDSLKAAAGANPNHIKWLLRSRFPEYFGRRDNVEQVNPEDKAADQAALRELLMDRLSKFLPEEQAVSTPDPVEKAAEKPPEPAISTPDSAKKGPETAPEAPTDAVA